MSDSEVRTPFELLWFRAGKAIGVTRRVATAGVGAAVEAKQGIDNDLCNEITSRQRCG